MTEPLDTLVSTLIDFERSTETNLASTEKEIEDWQNRQRVFDELSKDPDLGKWYSEYVEFARSSLARAQKRRTELETQLPKVRELLQEAVDLRRRVALKHGGRSGS